MRVTTLSFGFLPDGREVMLFQVECEKGMQISITNYGGIITSLKVPDRHQQLGEITAGFDSLVDYLKPHPYFGALIGRYAGRIAYGNLYVKNELYKLKMHDAYCHLHGGDTGFHTRLWDYEIDKKDGEICIHLSYLSPHGEENYPGNLTVRATYVIRDNNSFSIEYEAVTDAPTHLNLTNHAYFNLGGFRDTISDHQLQVNAHQSVELDEHMLPTGRLTDCSGTLLDFQKPVLLSDRNIPSEFELDHCFVVQNLNRNEIPAAVFYHEPTGRMMKVYTSQPGIQVYSGNFLDGSLKRNEEQQYFKHSALCFETQHFADSPNHPHFPSTFLDKGEIFKERTTFRFEYVE